MESLRNIKYTFRKYPVPLLLSMVGIVMAFCAFIIISTQVKFEKSFDRFHPKAECIFRVDQQEELNFRSIFPPGFAESVIHSSSHIEAGTVSCPFVGEVYVTITDAIELEGLKMEANLVSEGFFQVFGIQVLEGDKNFVKAGQVAVPQSVALRLFGQESAIGKEIRVEDSYFIESPTWTIGVVYKDLPHNSQIRNQLLFPLPESFSQNFSQSNFLCYLRIDQSDNASFVADEFNKRFDFKLHKFLHPIELTPLADVYFQEEAADSRIFKSGSRLQVYIMSFISFMILMIGFLNFTNFYTSLIPSRLKTINTRIVLGENVDRLRLEIMGETTLLLFLSALIALLISVPLSDSLQLQEVVQEAFHWNQYLSVAVLTLLIALAGGVITGIYPAFFATSFPVMEALKGNFSQTVSGKKIKKMLVVIQYIISSVLMIFVLFVFWQNRMMAHSNLHFDKDQIAVVELSKSMAKQKGEWLQGVLKQNPMVEEVAFASELMGSQDTYMTEGFVYKEYDFSTFLVFVSSDFLKVMGIPLLEGKDFSEQSKNDVIFNVHAKENFDMQLGPIPSKKLDIVGFCDDVKFNSYRNEQSPIAFRYLPVSYGFTPVAYIRLQAGFDAVSAEQFIRNTIARIDPNYPVEVLFYDQILQEQYNREIRFSRILTYFSVLAILLSLIGVFSMVIFDIQHKRKEIAIHKVFGAAYQDVIWMGNKPYFYIVLTGFLISVPISWFVVTGYLESFVQHVHITVWAFLIVFILLEVITSLLVLWRYHTAATENPKESLMS